MAELRIGTAAAAPGERAFGALQVGTLADGSAIDIPVVVINGTQPGKRLYVQAAVHGTEVNPLESMRRVLMELDPETVSGQIVAVPVANVIGFRLRERRTHPDGVDMNRVWPGKADGTISERMAHAIYSQAVAGADLVIDLHTGYSTMITHTIFGEGDPRSEELARSFGTEFLVMEEQDGESDRPGNAGKLRQVAAADGIPAITPELGGFSKFEGSPIQAGVMGISNVLVRYGFVRGDIIGPGRQVVIRDHVTRLTAEHGGVFVSTARPGEQVWETQELGYIYAPANFEIIETVRAPLDGVLVHYAENPVVNSGDTLVSLGRRR